MRQLFSMKYISVLATFTQLPLQYTVPDHLFVQKMFLKKLNKSRAWPHEDLFLLKVSNARVSF